MSPDDVSPEPLQPYISEDGNVTIEMNAVHKERSLRNAAGVPLVMNPLPPVADYT